MGLFDHFPYTNVHELNLDWILSMMKVLEAEWEAFTAGNSLTFADPMLHDVTKTYAKNTIVLDSNGNAYVSLQAVPVGVSLNDQDYWLMVFDYESFIEKVNKNFTNNYFRNVSSPNYNLYTGDWITLNDVLYKVTSNITAGTPFIIGTNIVEFTIEQFLKDFIVSVNATILQYKNDIDASEAQYRAELAQDIADTTQSLQTQFDAAISGVTVDSEVINARVGTNNITYGTLENRLNAQFNMVHNILNNLNCGNMLDIEGGGSFPGNSGTYDFKSGRLTLNGTENSSNMYNIYANTSAFPDGIKAGDTITCRQFADAPNTVIWQLWEYKSGSWAILGVVRDNPVQFTIDASSTGMIVRYVSTVGTYSNFITDFFITVGDTKTNKELEELIQNAGLPVSTLPSGSDLNDVATTGSYLLASGYNYSNSPVEDGYLEHYNHSVPFQIVYQLAGAAIYFRRKVGAAWIDWRRIRLTQPALFKKVAMFGDSITYGRDGGSATPIQVGVPIPRIVELNNSQLDVTNFGQGGVGWISTRYSSDIAYDIISSTDLTGYNVVTYMYGLNDWFEEIGSYTDDENSNTIMGEIYKCMKYVQTTYPGINQILIGMPNTTAFKSNPWATFPMYDYNTGNIFANGKSPKDFHDELVKFTDRYHMPFIDLNNSGISSWNIESLVPDNAHPNQKGYYVLGGYISGEINRIVG